MASVEYWELEELAAVVLGLSESTDSDTLEEALYEKFGISIEQFSNVALALLPFTPQVPTAICGTLVNAFVKGNVCIVKQAVEKV